MYKADPSLVLPGDVLEDVRRIQEESTEGAEKSALIQNYLDTPRPPEWEDMPLAERVSFFNGTWHQDARDVGIVDNTDDYILPWRTCAMEILCELFGMDKRNIRNIDIREINTILQHMPEWERQDSKDGILRFKLYGRQRAYIRKSKKGAQKVSTEVSTKASTEK